MDDDKEDAKILEFGEFSQAKCLTNSEVFVLLTQKKNQMREIIPDSVFEKTFKYVEKFGSYNGDKESTMQIRKELSKKKYDLHEFEISVLANLMPGTIDEAICLIPSLKRKNKDLIQELIDFLAPYFESEDFDEEEGEFGDV